MKFKKDLVSALEILKFFRKELAIFGLIWVLIIVIPVKNVFTFNLIILLVVLGNKLYTSVPVFKDWIVTSAKTILFVTLIYYVIRFITGWGVIGLIIIILAFAGYRLYRHKRFVNYIIDWSVGRLKGSDEKFNWSGKK